MLSCYFIFSLEKGSHLICVDLNLPLRMVDTDLYFYAVLLIFLLEQVFLFP